MQNQKASGILRLWRATGYSIEGLKAAWRNEAAFRQELFVVLLLTPAALWLGSNMVERSLLVLPLGLILITELINSALESAIDRIGLEKHELSGQAKNLGSAAVMISIIVAAVVWLLVAWGRFG